MGLGDKIGNAAKDAVGNAKEKAGEATGNDDLKHEGQKDQFVAGAKKAGEKVKDTAEDVGADIQDAAHRDDR